MHKQSRAAAPFAGRGTIIVCVSIG